MLTSVYTRWRGAVCVGARVCSSAPMQPALGQYSLMHSTECIHVAIRFKHQILHKKSSRPPLPASSGPATVAGPGPGSGAGGGAPGSFVLRHVGRCRFSFIVVYYHRVPYLKGENGTR
ncbi:uncharacterized protein LOC121727435 [Aricia agestis]|uniref:uncharacterized protein LOC121727435 n=1 Tax=Aricia agestis TaxID=91739 RepID=UPI001C205E9A|nr:uncharacterized protein LOC121727435 [Aricia agestis]